MTERQDGRPSWEIGEWWMASVDARALTLILFVFKNYVTSGGMDIHEWADECPEVAAALDECEEAVMMASKVDD